MFNQCTSLQALFETVIISDSLAESSFLSLEPVRTTDSVLSRSNGVWSYDESGEGYDSVVAWCDANNITLPTTAQLTSLFKDSDEPYGNVFLTAGELALFVGYVYTYANVKYHMTQSDDQLDSRNLAVKSSAKVISVDIVNRNYQWRPRAGDNMTFRPFFQDNLYVDWAPNAARYVIGTHCKTDGIDSESDVNDLIGQDGWGDAVIVWNENGSIPTQGTGNLDFLFVFSDGSTEARSFGSTTYAADGGNKIAVLGMRFVGNRLDVKVRHGYNDHGLFGSSYRWEWAETSVDLQGKEIVDILIAQLMYGTSIHYLSLFSNVNGWNNRLAASIPYIKLSAKIVDPARGTSIWLNQEPGSTSALTLKKTVNLGGTGTFNLTFSQHKFSDTNVVDYDGEIPAVQIVTYGRREPIANIWTLSKPRRIVPSSLADAVNAEIDVTQSALYYQYSYPTITPPSDLEYTIYSSIVYEYQNRSVTVSATVADDTTLTDDNVASWLTQNSGVSWTDMIRRALETADAFNADDILDGGDLVSLKSMIADRYSVMDTYMAMYADYTANVVVDSIVNNMILSLVTGDEKVVGEDDEGNVITNIVRYPMQPTYKVSDDTVISALGYNFSCKSLRESSDMAVITPVVTALYALQKDLNYRLTLFNEMHEAFQDSDSLKNFASAIRAKIQDLRSEAMLIMQSRGVASEALLLNCAYQQNAYDRVSTAISNAISAGYSTLSDAIDYINRIAPELGYNFVEGSTSAELYQSILEKSSYGDYQANIVNPVKAIDSNVSYWKSYQLRLGASILNNPSPDAEFSTASEGSLYLWPALFVMLVKSADFDANLTNQCFYVPFRYSYLCVRGTGGNQYELSWLARFNGGTDADLYAAISASVEEFFQIGREISQVYAGQSVTVNISHPELPGGYDGSARVDNIVGCLGLLISGVLGGALSGYGVKNEDGSSWSMDYSLPNGKTGKLGSVGASSVVGLAASTLISLSQSIWPDEKAIANANWSTAALISSAKSPNFYNNVEISGYEPLNGKGVDAFNHIASVLLWALRYGLIAPIGDYANESVGIGVFSPSYITPKYYYRGESSDYSALMITAGVALTAVYTVRYSRLKKVRTAEFIPVTIASTGISTAGTVLSEIAAEDVASESDMMDVADMVSGDDGENVDDRVQSLQSTVGTVEDYENGLNGVVSDAITVLGVIGSLASVMGIVDDTTAEIKECVIENGAEIKKLGGSTYRF